MSKYETFGNFLKGHKEIQLPLTFAEIEKIIGHKLPHSARYPAWWSNNPSNNVMTRIWLEAGFKTEQVDIEKRRLVFRRVETASKPVQTGKDIHPLFGCMAGTIRIMPGTDLTEPSLPEWPELTEEKWRNMSSSRG